MSSCFVCHKLYLKFSIPDKALPSLHPLLCLSLNQSFVLYLSYSTHGSALSSTHTHARTHTRTHAHTHTHTYIRAQYKASKLVGHFCKYCSIFVNANVRKMWPTKVKFDWPLAKIWPVANCYFVHCICCTSEEEGHDLSAIINN